MSYHYNPSYCPNNLNKEEEDVDLLTVVDPVMWNTVPVASDRIINQHLKVKDEKKVSKQQNIEFSLSATPSNIRYWILKLLWWKRHLANCWKQTGWGPAAAPQGVEQHSLWPPPSTLIILKWIILERKTIHKVRKCVNSKCVSSIHSDLPPQPELS